MAFLHVALIVPNISKPLAGVLGEALVWKLDRNYGRLRTDRPKLIISGILSHLITYFLFLCLIDDNNRLEMHYLVTCKEDADKVRQACIDSGNLKFQLYNSGS